MRKSKFGLKPPPHNYPNLKCSTSLKLPSRADITGNKQTIKNYTTVIDIYLCGTFRHLYLCLDGGWLAVICEVTCPLPPIVL